jgi:hypothetical protein
MAPMNLQDAQCDLERRGNELPIDSVIPGEVEVCSSGETSARSNVATDCDSNRLIYNPSELVKKPFEPRVPAQQGKDKRAMGKHSLTNGVPPLGAFEGR